MLLHKIEKYSLALGMVFFILTLLSLPPLLIIEFITGTSMLIVFLCLAIPMVVCVFTCLIVISLDILLSIL